MHRLKTGEDIALQTALNHMTTPGLSYPEFLDLAGRLGCVGVEVRNDIDRELFDGADPAAAGRMAQDRGLRLVGLSQVYPFNDWTTERATSVRSLIDTAVAAKAETISLIPRNDGTVAGGEEGRAQLRMTLAAIQPMLRDAGIVALVEPLGFRRSSLRAKSDLIDAIDAIGGREHFRLVHDTFHHTLAGGGPLFPDRTGIVHISGVTDADLHLDQMEDEHRVLVDDDDRLGNVDQLRRLCAEGYDGPVSVECFSSRIHALADPFTHIKKSFDFISARLHAHAA